jgi:cytochrome P450
VILKLLDLPETVYPHLRDWATDVMTGLGTPDPRPEWVLGADRAFAEMTEVFKVAIAERRAAPRGADDFLTALIEAREGEDRLTDDQLVAVLQTVLVAGHDTTGNSMTLGVAALAKHPQAWDYMYRNPDQMMPSVIELMRYIAMSAAQNRVAGQDFEWHGHQIRKGDVIYLMLAAGNRDPRVFDNPDALDLTRANNDLSLTFAPGLHHCIGHLLAKMQLTEFFGALTQRFEGAEVLDDKIEYLPVLVFRGVPSLNVRFRKRAS